MKAFLSMIRSARGAMLPPCDGAAPGTFDRIDTGRAATTTRTGVVVAMPYGFYEDTLTMGGKKNDGSKRQRISTTEYLARYREVLLATRLRLTQDPPPRSGGLTDRLLRTALANTGSGPDQATPAGVATAALSLLCMKGPQEYGLLTASVCRAIALDPNFVDPAPGCWARYRRLRERPHRLKAAGYGKRPDDEDVPALIIAGAVMTEIAFHRFSEPLAAFDRPVEDEDSDLDVQILVQRNPLRLHRDAGSVERTEWARWFLFLRSAVGAYDPGERRALQAVLTFARPRNPGKDVIVAVKRVLARDRFINKSMSDLLRLAFIPTDSGESQLSEHIDKLLELLGYSRSKPKSGHDDGTPVSIVPRLDIMSDPVTVGPLVAYEACARVRELQGATMADNARAVVASIRAEGVAVDALKRTLVQVVEDPAADEDEVAEAILDELEADGSTAPVAGIETATDPVRASEPAAPAGWVTALGEVFRLPSLAFAGAVAALAVFLVPEIGSQPDLPPRLAMRGGGATVLLVTGEGTICAPQELARGPVEPCRVSVGDKLEVRYLLEPKSSLNVANVVLWDRRSGAERSQWPDLGPTTADPDCPDGFCALATSEVSDEEPFRLGVFLTDGPPDDKAIAGIEADMDQTACLRRTDIVGFHFELEVVTN